MGVFATSTFDAIFIKAARDTEALSLLPAAMLLFYDLKMETIVNAGKEFGLDSGTLDTILSAIPTMWTLAAKYSFKSILEDKMQISDRCLEPAKCFEVRKELRRQLEPWPCIINPVEVIAFGSGSTAAKLCVHCFDKVKEEYSSGRKAVFEELPQAFGLPDWATMRRKERETYGFDEDDEEDDELSVLESVS